MSWFAAHVIMAVEYKSKRQERWPAWENIVLVQAKSAEEAFDKAERYGRDEEGDDDGTLTWQGQPAHWIFVGVRKITTCADSANRPGDLSEVTYNEFEASSWERLKDFAAGKAASIRSTDPFADAPRASSKTIAPHRAKRA